MRWHAGRRCYEVHYTGPESLDVWDSWHWLNMSCKMGRWRDQLNRQVYLDRITRYAKK